jgi:acetyltransferase-like isoleucine patch superfamily enzyme
MDFGRNCGCESVYFFKRLLRLFAKFAFPNNVRISLLKMAGVKIGNDVYIATGITLACDLGLESNLNICDRVSIAPNVIFILTSDPNMSRLRLLKNIFQSVEIKGIITINRDAWIGAGSIILPNITIGECAIVGAGSVVTKDVPPYTVVAGNPAKVIRILEAVELFPGIP